MSSTPNKDRIQVTSSIMIANELDKIMVTVTPATVKNKSTLKGFGGSFGGGLYSSGGGVTKTLFTDASSSMVFNPDAIGKGGENDADPYEFSINKLINKGRKVIIEKLSHISRTLVMAHLARLKTAASEVEMMIKSMNDVDAKAVWEEDEARELSALERAQAIVGDVHPSLMMTKKARASLSNSFFSGTHLAMIKSSLVYAVLREITVEVRELTILEIESEFRDITLRAPTHDERSKGVTLSDKFQGYTNVFMGKTQEMATTIKSEELLARLFISGVENVGLRRWISMILWDHMHANETIEMYVHLSQSREKVAIKLTNFFAIKECVGVILANADTMYNDHAIRNPFIVDGLTGKNWFDRISVDFSLNRANKYTAEELRLADGYKRNSDRPQGKWSNKPSIQVKKVNREEKKPDEKKTKDPKAGDKRKREKSNLGCLLCNEQGHYASGCKTKKCFCGKTPGEEDLSMRFKTHNPYFCEKNPNMKKK